MKHRLTLSLLILLIASALVVMKGSAAGGYDLSWWTVDSGGATFSTGGNYSLAGTIGQHDAAEAMGGGAYTVTGGFWALPGPPPPEYTLTINSDHGSVTADVPPPYHEGDVVELTCHPDVGWSFLEWSGDLVSTANPASITMDGNKSVTANYEEIECTLGDSWVGGVSIQSDRNVVAVGRPHVGDEVTSYSGFPTGGLTSYVPMLFKNAWGTYDSAFYVQNLDDSLAAHVTVKYYDTKGQLSCTKPEDTIPALASHGTWVPSEACLPVGWVGGAVVTSSDSPIVVVARPHVGAQVMTYNGFSTGGLTTYLPMLFKNAFGGSYDSAFYVQNVDPDNEAHVTVKYYDTNGNLSCTKPEDTIPPLSSHGIWVPSETCLSVGWVGGAVITSSDYPIVAVARPHVGAEVTTYDGFTEGSLRAYAPMLFKNAFGGSYDSAFYIQNLDSSNEAHVTVEYYDSSGKLSCTKPEATIPALSSKGIWVPSETCLPVGWVGGAVITSSDYPIVIVGRPHVGPRVTTYNGFAAGNLNMSLPMLFKSAFGGSYNSAFYIQNTDAEGPASVDISFYDADGNLNHTRSTSIPALATVGYWLPSVACEP